MIEDNNKINLLVWIKKFIRAESITILTVVLYSWGLLFNYLYYIRFNVNIFKYLSLQETLLDTLAYVILIIILILLTQSISLTITFFIIRFFSKNRRQWIEGIKNRESAYLLDLFLLSIFIELMCMLMLVLILSLGYTVLKMDFNLFFKIVFPTLALAALVKFILTYSLLKNNNYQFFNYIFIFLFIASFIFMIARRTADTNLKGKANPKSSFELVNGNIYNTNDSLLFIGETTSTIFLYDNSNKKTIIINRNNLIQTIINN